MVLRTVAMVDCFRGARITLWVATAEISVVMPNLKKGRGGR
jgi:hypothetical protein